MEKETANLFNFNSIICSYFWWRNVLRGIMRGHIKICRNLLLKILCWINPKIINILKNLGYNAGLSEKSITWKTTTTQSALLWLREGAELEDAGSILQMALGYGRSFNHFHNPLKCWANAGLDDRIVLPPFHVTGESSLLWAQDSTKQASYTDLEGNWSWQKVREHFYTALTGKEFQWQCNGYDSGSKGRIFRPNLQRSRPSDASCSRRCPARPRKE